MPPSLRKLGRSVERLIGSDVREGEWHLVGLFFANLFLLLTAYYILKVIREPLILLGGGAVSRSYARGVQAGLLFVVIPAYSLLANRFEPARLVKWIFGVFVFCLTLFFALGRLGVGIGFAFFVWLGIFSTLSIAQFWSLATDIMTESEGKRLFPIIAAGGTVGGILGAQLAARAIERLHPHHLMLVAAALLAGCMLLTHVSHGAGLGHRERVPHDRNHEWDERGGFALLVGDRYLLLIGLSVLVLNFVNTTGDFILAEMVNSKARTLAVASRKHFIGAFYGDFQTWVSVLTAVVQIVVVARVFRKVGIGGALFFLPLLAVSGYGTSAALPALAVVSAVKVVENSTDYSLQNTIQQALFLPTSRDAKYKAKSAIDTLSVRLGDLISTALVFVGVHLHFKIFGFALVNVGAGLIWIWIVVHLRRRQVTLAMAIPAPRLGRGWHRYAAAVAFVAALARPVAARPDPPRWFADRPVAWQEHDDADVPAPPESNHLQELMFALIVRDSLANEADRLLSLEGRTAAADVNALDEVPCSTWFCARNHLRPMTIPEIVAGPAAAPPRPPFKITKGKHLGAAAGFQVQDADGHKFMLKFDVAGHLGMANAGEMIGYRIFHAAGYNVPGAFAMAVNPADFTLDPAAKFELYNVERRPLTDALVKSTLAKVAHGADGRVRAVAVPWIPGTILGGFDMIGVRRGDPNDRIPHQNRSSLRASWVLFAWLSVLDPSSINTIDSYRVEEGRHLVRHYFFDFGCSFGSATNYAQGIQQDGEYSIEVGRTLASLFTLGAYRRPFQDRRDEWVRLTAEHPALGYFPAETFNPDTFRTNQRIPSHMRMTERDAYWGAKLVTSFSDEQIGAIVATAGLPEADARYIDHGLRARRDIIGRRYLRAVAAVENPSVSPDGTRICFQDLAIARGYAQAAEVRYQVQVTDGRGKGLAAYEQQAVGPAACVSIGSPASTDTGYRVVEIRSHLIGPAGHEGNHVSKAARVHLRWRAAEGRFVLVGLERDE